MIDDNSNGHVAWPPPDAPEWLRESLANVPAPTADMDPKVTEADEAKAIERKLVATLPKSYRWAARGVPELAQRVHDVRRGGAEPVTIDWLLDTAPKTSWLVLSGPASSGKTSLAVAMMREWSKARRQPADFVHAFRLGIARIQNKAGTGEADLVDRAMRAPLVLIDDVGSERDTANNAMLDVIFERHAEDLPTWVTTGLSGTQITNRYGAGFLRRITERATLLSVGRQ